jgi:hypothetical protein
MRLKSNGGTMEVKKQAIMPGYHGHVWYNKKAITNISLFEQHDQAILCHVRQQQSNVCGALGAGRKSGHGILDAQEWTTLF